MSLRFVRPEDRRFVPVGDLVSEKERAEAAPDELEGEICVRYPGGSDEVQLLEIRYPPDTGVRPHAHDVDEVFVVTEGEVRFGNQTYGVGSSVLIGRLTLYSFTAGPAGVTLLNFRPRQDSTLYRPAQVRALRAGGSG